MAAEVLRRLSGQKTETSPVFNMTTQFGGGKTHSLTLLYHLANSGPKAKSWQGVGRLLVSALREAATAAGIDDVFVPAENEDLHALEFYRALGGAATPVTFFTFPRPEGS